MGCVKSTPIQEQSFDVDQQPSFMVPSRPLGQSKMKGSASWSPGEKMRLHQGPLSTLPANSYENSANTGQVIHLPAYPKDLDLTKMDVPTLSKLLRDEQTITENDTTAAKLHLPFMAPSSEAEKPQDSDISTKSKVIVTSPFDSSVKYYVEDPSEVLFGIDAFPRGDENISPDDTIWSEKRELMPSYNYVKSLDKRALKAPEDLRKAKPDKIVNYLTKGAKNDFQRFRVLFRWVAHAISYDVRFNTTIGEDGCSQAPLDVLQSGKTDCCGYSKLLQYLCSLVEPQTGHTNEIDSRPIKDRTKNYVTPMHVTQGLSIVGPVGV